MPSERTARPMPYGRHPCANSVAPAKAWAAMPSARHGWCCAARHGCPCLPEGTRHALHGKAWAPGGRCPLVRHVQGTVRHVPVPCPPGQTGGTLSQTLCSLADPSPHAPNVCPLYVVFRSAWQSVESLAMPVACHGTAQCLEVRLWRQGTTGPPNNPRQHATTSPCATRRNACCKALGDR